MITPTNPTACHRPTSVAWWRGRGHEARARRRADGVACGNPYRRARDLTAQAEQSFVNDATALTDSGTYSADLTKLTVNVVD